MPTAGIFDEVAVLEKRLLDAQRGQASAERNAKRLADLLAGEKRAHAEVSKDLGIAKERIAVLEVEVGHAQGLRGRLSESERKQFAAEKKAANFETDLKAMGAKYGKVLGERDEARGELRVALAEKLRLEAEVEPARALAHAITKWQDAQAEIISEAAKIRGEQ